MAKKHHKLKKILAAAGAAIALIAGAEAPIVPQDMKLVMSYQYKAADYKAQFVETSPTTTAKVRDNPQPAFTDDDGNGIISVSVFQNADSKMVYQQIPDKTYGDMGKVDGQTANPTKIELVPAASFFMPKPAHAAIARDNFISTMIENGSVTSQTISYTNAGDYLVVDTSADGALEVLATVAYNGDSLTQLAKVAETGTRWWYIYGMIAPATGVHNIVVTSDGTSTTFRTLANSYTGTAQTGQPDAAGNATALFSSSVSKALTASQAGDWAVAYVRDDAVGVLDGTNLVALSNASAIRSLDSNGTVGTGSQTMTANATDASGSMYIVVALIKVAASVVPANIQRPPFIQFQ